MRATAPACGSFSEIPTPSREPPFLMGRRNASRPSPRSSSNASSSRNELDPSFMLRCCPSHNGTAMQRPPGVTILAVLSFVFALAILLSILGSGLPLGGGSFLPRLSFWVANLLSQVADWGSHAVGGLAMVALDRVIPPLLFIFVAIYILMALLYAAIGMGFLRMRNWARLR